MSPYTTLLIVVVLMVVGAIALWPRSASWSDGHSGGLGPVALVQRVLLLTGRLS
ncbi:MAG: DUF3309 family protein [Pseudomonadota bacterium]|nr:DUF3309 family protein [Pseudomonadota bacterium]